MCAMCSSAATPPRLWWTGQLVDQVLTATSCTCTAQRATSCGAARMGSGGTLFQIRKFDGVGHHLPPIVASMPAIHGTRRAEELDAHTPTTGLDHGLATLS